MSDFKTELAYSTDSVGMHPSHTLSVKLRAIHDVGFRYIGLAFPSLRHRPSRNSSGGTQN